MLKLVFLVNFLHNRFYKNFNVLSRRLNWAALFSVGLKMASRLFEKAGYSRMILKIVNAYDVT